MELAAYFVGDVAKVGDRARAVADQCVAARGFAVANAADEVLPVQQRRFWIVLVSALELRPADSCLVSLIGSLGGSGQYLVPETVPR